jgi:hypothetical protein
MNRRPWQRRGRKSGIGMQIRRPPSDVVSKALRFLVTGVVPGDASSPPQLLPPPPPSHLLPPLPSPPPMMPMVATSKAGSSSTRPTPPPSLRGDSRVPPVRHVLSSTWHCLLPSGCGSCNNNRIPQVKRWRMQRTKWTMDERNPPPPPQQGRERPDSWG